MFFSIAPQSVTIPGGPTLTFTVDATDSSLCTITAGAHVITFKRNGDLISVVETPSAEPAPLAGYKSVNDDAVRTEATKQSDIGKGMAARQAKTDATAAGKDAPTPPPFVASDPLDHPSSVV